MKRATGLTLAAVVLWLCIASAFAAEVLTNDAVVAMVKADLSEELILNMIKISENQFDLSTQGLLRLKDSGISETVIKAMARRPHHPRRQRRRRAETMAQETQDAIALYRQARSSRQRPRLTSCWRSGRG